MIAVIVARKLDQAASLVPDSNESKINNLQSIAIISIIILAQRNCTTEDNLNITNELIVGFRDLDEKQKDVVLLDLPPREIIFNDGTTLTNES